MILGMSKFKPGIYQIVHTASSKLYVGSAKYIARRWIEHVRDLRKGNHSSRQMQNAWNKYGAEAFVFSVLENVDDVNDLLAREQFWLDKTQAAKRDIGYNYAVTAGSLLGFVHTEETKKKMSIAHIGLVRSDEHKRNLSIVNTGKKMSDESRQKMREAKLGTKRGPHSPETRAKIAASNKGKIHSEETRKKIALTRIGKTASPEVRARMSAAQKARRKIAA